MVGKINVIYKQTPDVSSIILDCAIEKSINFNIKIDGIVVGRIEIISLN